MYQNWKSKVPLRVVAFGWLALRGSILTMDNLSCKRRFVVNAFPVCLEAEEKMDHLLLNYKVNHIIWKAIYGWFGVSGVLPSSIISLFEA